MARLPEVNLDLGELNPKQGLILTSKAQEILFGGAAGPGKALCLGEIVCTPFGFRKIEDIHIGDLVSSPDGSSTKVIAETHIHERECFRVSFNDGTSVTVSDEHLWKTWKVGGRSKREKASVSGVKGSLCTTLQLKKLVDEHLHKIKIPISAPIKFTKAYKTPQRTIHPYLLGVLIGDGSITQQSVNFASVDPEISDKLTNLGYPISHHADGIGHAVVDRGDTKRKLEKLGLWGKLAQDKHIPECYKFAPMEDRYELIRGLFDTDGTVDKNGYLQYVSVSKQLADDVAFVLRSLGCYVRITTKQGNYTKNGERILCRTVYSLYVQSLNNRALFFLPRKKERCIPNQYMTQNKTLGKAVISVESIGKKLCKCITVEHPDGLFIATDGFIVTHNSHALRIIAIKYCLDVPHLQVFLFRRNRPDLLANHMDGPSGFRALLAPYVDAGLVSITEDEIRFNFNKAKIHLCHCDDPRDIYKYQGAEIHLLLIDEATLFQEDMIRFLRTRVRAFSLDIPEGYKGMLPRIIYASNPGNVGHSYFKRAFIDPHPPYTLFYATSSDGGMLRQFIPAALSDNKFADPNYANQIRGLGSPELVRAYLNGDWNINLGCFFPEFSNLHVIKPFRLPEKWTRVRAMDWGGRDPCVVGWLTITPEDFALNEEAPFTQKDGYLNQVYKTDRRIIPAKSIILHREWYIADERDKGLRLSNYDLAKGIVEREEPGEHNVWGVAGRDVFISRGGPSIAAQINMLARDRYGQGLFTRPADNRRVAGWNIMRSLFQGEDGYPQFYVFDTCRNAIRLIPMLQYDDRKSEDAKQDMDHYCEMLRYGIMSWITPSKNEREEEKPSDWTLDYLTKDMPSFLEPMSNNLDGGFLD